MVIAHLAAVAIGGALGATLRYVVSTNLNGWWGPTFPVGTLTVNVVGSFIMGGLYVFFNERVELPVEFRLALVVGVLGAFTTFSTFSMETIGLLEAGALGKAVLNVVASVGVCLAGCAAGLALGRATMS